MQENGFGLETAEFFMTAFAHHSTVPHCSFYDTIISLRHNKMLRFYPETQNLELELWNVDPYISAPSSSLKLCRSNVSEIFEVESEYPTTELCCRKT